MRVLFAGSPDIAVPSLIRVSFEHEIVGVLTNPESARGRGLGLERTPVAEAAEAVLGAGSPVLSPQRLGPETREAVGRPRARHTRRLRLRPHLRPEIPLPVPQGRGQCASRASFRDTAGPAPIPAAILGRDSETAITVQRLALEMDTGDILGQLRLPLSGTETAEDISEVAAIMGADLLSQVLEDIAEGQGASQATGRRAELLLHSEEGGRPHRLGKASPRHRRADSGLSIPGPGAFTCLQGMRLNVLDAFPYPHVTFAAGPNSLDFEDAPPGTVLGLDKSRGIMVQTIDGLIALRRLQVQQKKALPYREFANGMRNLAGTVLGGGTVLYSGDA